MESISNKLLELGFEQVTSSLVRKIIENKWFDYDTEVGILHIYKSEGLGFEMNPYKSVTEHILKYVKKHLGYITISGKVQTVNGVNVVVETALSTNTHGSIKNKPVIITKILDRRDVNVEGEKVLQELRNSNDERDWAILDKFYADILKTRPGFAISQCSTSIKNEGIMHAHGDIMKYKLKSK